MIKTGKVITVSIFAMIVFGFTLSRNSSDGVRVQAAQDDSAATYKAKCAMCHKAKADKLYNPDLPEDEQVQAILKGKKGAKPPDMPSFESKGITEDKAKALVAYMKSLKAAPKQ